MNVYVPSMPCYYEHPRVSITHLSVDNEQYSSINALYKSKSELSLVFSLDKTGQAHAAQVLYQLGLDRESRVSLENRWKIRWSTEWKSGAQDRKRRLLLQCSSGFNSDAKFHASKQTTAQSTSIQGDRRNPYDFTGCLSHVELTERESDGAVSRLVGILQHNEACRHGSIVRIPSVPLHSHVYEVALQQRRNGANLPAVQATNLEMLNSKAYRGMGPQMPRNFHYHFLPSDSCQLYRLFNKSYGVNISLPPTNNLHSWMDPTSPSFCPGVFDTVFYYAGWTHKEERLKVCISTNDMDDAAWRYAHGSQLILDGTFGVCSSRLLLFIAMADDGKGKGIPIAFFLFSAPTGNKATHAGYNHQIIRELLAKWRDHLSVGHPCVFCPLVAITDTDTKECGTLQDRWSEIWLVLCRFHVSSCWTNKRKSLLHGHSFWIQYTVRRLQELELRGGDPIFGLPCFDVDAAPPLHL
ncbi:hypothetical protein HWV62_32579 [Athelia sp. TMB]|nr:hypothetical protein HWV62_32579 [Athelia sp. TMB]